MSVRSLAVFGTLQVAVAVFSSAQVITFSVKTEEGRVDALVTDHGKPVLDLRPGDFEVIDNGVTQQIEFVSFEEIPICSVLALDMSASVAGGRLDKLKDAGTAFLDALRKDESAALVMFSSFVSLRCPFSTDAGMVKAALREAKPAGATSLIDGSYAGLELAESGAGRPLLILVSDGLDTSSWLSRQAVLDRAKRGYAVAYAVSGGDLNSDPFLRDLTEITGGSLFEKSISNLDEVFVKNLNEFRQRYLITYSPQGVPKGGWHRLTVRVKGRKLTIKARTGYNIPSRGERLLPLSGLPLKPE